MAKKSNKTSHVLNLLTNRTGLTAEDLEHTENTEVVADGVVNTQAAVQDSDPIIDNIEDNINKEVQHEIEEAVAEKISTAVSEQIREELEKVEAKEHELRIQAKAAQTSIKSSVADAPTTPVIAVFPEASPPKVEAYAPLAFEDFSDETLADEPVVPEPVVPEPVVPEPVVPEPVVPEPVVPEPVVSEPDVPEPIISTQPSGTMKDLILINILEDLTRLTTLPVMESLDMCCCEKCQNDVMALTLNSIAPKYVVTQKGALFAKISAYGIQYKTDLVTAITAACIRVKNSPNH